jgi:hypothetical protein
MNDRIELAGADVDERRRARTLDRGLHVFRRAHARDPRWRRAGEVYDGVIEPVGVALVAAAQIGAALLTLLS